MPTAVELLSSSSVLQLAKVRNPVAPGEKWGAVKESISSFDEMGLSERVGIVRAALLAELPSILSGECHLTVGLRSFSRSMRFLFNAPH